MSVFPTSSDDVKLIYFGCFEQLLFLKLGCYLEKNYKLHIDSTPWNLSLCGILKWFGWQNLNFSEPEKLNDIFKDF